MLNVLELSDWSRLVSSSDVDLVSGRRQAERTPFAGMTVFYR